MLLRSSSTPLLGSLLPPDPIGKPSPSTLAFHCNTSSPAAAAASLHSSPFRRTNSDGNLYTLDSKPNLLSRSILQSIPSFSFYGQEERDYDYQHTDLDDEDEVDGRFRIQNRTEAAIASPDKLESSRLGSGDGLGFFSEGDEMYLASGIGMGGGGGGRWSGGGGGGGGGGGDEQQGMEDYYRKMMVENPGNAMVLSNYAEFLYQWKGDLRGAEEYYGRAILMDSSDGEILSKYAKLVWELHHDQLKASSYYQRAVQASPHDSHVQAAYANFLWETEDYENDDNNEHGIVKEMATQTCRGTATA